MNRHILRLAKRNPGVLEILRRHFLRVRAARLYPLSQSLQEKWVEARLHLRRRGCRSPRVHISSGRNVIFARGLPRRFHFGDIE